ncbi:hypothetical protein M422DRAFT_777382 [Sphaerobolus stellatus SS14]|nr:hypothetical protein M422DRAFT_777382 [Sphaerobolus stellatus SS14]
MWPGERKFSQPPMDREYHSHESGRHRSPFEHARSSTRRSPPPSDDLYAPLSSSRVLPPIHTHRTSSPPRGMPSSAYPTYRPQSPPRFEDPNTYSSGLWQETRGLPSQPPSLAPLSYPSSYDMRPYQAQSSYYPTAPFPEPRSTGRLPSLSVDTYLPRASPSYQYPTTNTRGTSYYPSASPQTQPRHSAYTQTVPFTSGAEWGASAGLDMHRTDHYSSAYGYGTSGTHDRSGGSTEPWGAGDLPSPSSERADSSEPLIKKKRKRADANQLRVLNATYQRTAFPSTQEREALAKELDMSPRSVQIWFQNKRQSMRQSRNAANNLPPILHHTYSSPNPAEPRPTHQPYHALSEASTSRRREPTPDDHRHRR